MLFFEYSFLFIFLPIVLFVYLFLPKKLKNGWLFLASCVFYAASSLYFLPILLASTLLDYIVGKRIFAADSRAGKKKWLLVSIIFNLAVLALFKYVGFITQTLHQDLGWAFIPLLSAPLPIGISFYTFQSMSYSIDMYRGKVEPAKNLIDFACYITMFPQLIAGPIVRFSDISTQLIDRAGSKLKSCEGLRFFILGLAKKILIADTAAYFADPIFDGGSPGFWTAWSSVFLYAVQIYFDFSGYSDMAVGLGKLLGFDFPQNFDSPYKAVSFSDFWRRWHMTLSFWLRDNLYIPLGGNRKGLSRTYVNLMITMLLGGLWHGAAWNFLLWGMYHGLWLSLERFFNWENPRAGIPRRLFIFVAVSVGWVFFRCEDLSQSITWFKAMFSPLGENTEAPLHLILATLILTLPCFLFKNTWEQKPKFNIPTSFLYAALFALCIIVAYGKGSSPFLYFRF